MTKPISFRLRQLFKMCLQNLLLPCVYNFWHFRFRKQEKKQILLADSHHDAMPFSMAYMYQVLTQRGAPVVLDICNYSKLSLLHSTLRAIRFMKQYAQAKTVFICDSFLPAVSCKKDPDTKLVQLMHSCGLGKKIGYDATDDIPAGYRGYVYRNYDLVTVTSPNCVEPIAHGMRHSTDVVRAIGSSRSDFYFDPQWVQQRREDFYAAYPQAIGKTVILWAPTFRGNAADPRQVGMEQIEELEQALGEDFFLIRKVHPHVDNRYHLSNCTIPTEYLLPVADLMITDYSSIVVDFMFFQKPYVLFVPDLAQYLRERGTYVDLPSMSPYMVEHVADLKTAVLQALHQPCQDWVARNRQFHLSACDGRSTERILELLGI